MHQCDHTCINTIGSYACTCDSGYTLNVDGRTCDGRTLLLLLLLELLLLISPFQTLMSVLIITIFVLKLALIHLAHMFVTVPLDMFLILMVSAVSVSCIIPAS